MKHIFHHMIGDTTHGDGKHNQLFRDKLNCSRLLLHSNALQLAHPDTGEDLMITAPIDLEMVRVFDEIGFSDTQLI